VDCLLTERVVADDVKPKYNNVLLIGPCKLTSGVANWGAPHLGLHRIASWLRKHSGVTGKLAVELLSELLAEVDHATLAA